ncbi:hypothetical protein R3X27_00115 [Tropicimonas sp. TH_r6]|uniref:COG4223 family protein n=1 Tax=Tropicimonas sp. TH_r6 TaxID=3082085 RepID=UPI00295358DF|nr:hypothetical protein [Tropicimonas sp. TH_r6]MDV7141073.1 hypothetical protein [Tropicimonas sp. TH_r6]
MADTKKSDTASEATERSEDDIVEEPQKADVETGEEDTTSVQEETVSEDGIEDAEILDEVPAEETTDAEVPSEEGADDPFDGSDPDSADLDPFAEPESDEDIPDLEALDGVESTEIEASESSDDAISEETEETEEPEAEPAESPASAETVTEAPVSEPTEPHVIEKETVVVERKGAVVPGFLGGAIAAIGLVFAAPYVIPPKYLPSNPQIEEAIDGQAETITALEAELAAVRGQLAETVTADALSDLKAESESGLSELKTLLGAAATAASVDDVASSVASVADRLGDLEKRPLDQTADPAAIAAVEAYGREMADLRESVTAQMAEAQTLVKDATSAAQTAVSEAIAASDTAVADAEAAAKAAEEKAAAEAALAAEKALRAARAQAMVDIQLALENGSGYAELLTALDGIDIPPALQGAAGDGVATLPELREAFTLVAREALNVSRTEVSDGSPGDRASTWIQNQLGVRSLAPSEGDDPDAVLSRAEAALAETRITDAIAELSALPEGGQEIMAEWVATATARAEALAAADELAASLATN